MAAKLRCSKCGQALTPESRKVLNGQTLCPSCYREAIEDAKKQEKEFETLIEYIKYLFGISEVPLEWLEQIKTYTKDKTYFGIRATLYYYYEILGNIPDPDKGLWAIKYEYEAAAKYFQKQQEINQQNEQVDLTPVTRTIIMNRPTNETRKPKYNIEDL